jgi:hypothetical protein
MSEHVTRGEVLGLVIKLAAITTISYFTMKVGSMVFDYQTYEIFMIQM